jgi:hypothetical protein
MLVAIVVDGTAIGMVVAEGKVAETMGMGKGEFKGVSCKDKGKGTRSKGRGEETMGKVLVVDGTVGKSEGQGEGKGKGTPPLRNCPAFLSGAS